MAVKGMPLPAEDRYLFGKPLVLICGGASMSI